MTVFDLIEQAAGGHSASAALLAPGRRPLTYSELQQQTAATAAAMRAAGIAATDRVAVVLPNGPEMASALLGVSSGAACAPLNPAYGADELRFYLSDLDARAVVLKAGDIGPARTVAGELGVQCLDVLWDDEWPAGRFEIGIRGKAGTEPTVVPPRGEDLALVLHTSGTTSRPKMVPLSHANLCASARNVVRALGLAEADRCLNIMPLFHIHGIVAALLGSLASAGSIVCTPGLRDGLFGAWLEETLPTWTTAVPSIYQALLAGSARDPEATSGTTLRLLRSSSASLPPAVMRELEGAFEVPVIEAYGMTEAAHQIACNPLPPASRKPGSVGVAAGPELGIMDASGALLPRSATGEVVICGDNVTSGYISNPEANAMAYAGRWFRTGDQGYIDEEGYLFLTGRLKEIINRGGEKVSPREVDEALLEHPAVAQAVAFAVSHETLGEDIAAAVVLKPGADVSEAHVRGSLFGRLAEFKIPSRLIIVDEIPKGATGKIQRIGLASRLSEQLKESFVEPRDATEASLARIFAEILGPVEVGAFSNFFSLGGDSLRGFQVLSRIRDEFGANLTILDLFKEPTVAALAPTVIEASEAAVDDELDRLLTEIESISEEEAGRQLQQLRGRKDD